jgi:xylose isomerase
MLHEKAWLEEKQRQESEMEQYDTDVAAVKARLIKRFDRDKDGVLNRVEQQEYDQYMSRVRSGRERNPFISE